MVYACEAISREETEDVEDIWKSVGSDVKEQGSKSVPGTAKDSQFFRRWRGVSTRSVFFARHVECFLNVRVIMPLYTSSLGS